MQLIRKWATTLITSRAGTLEKEVWEIIKDSDQLLIRKIITGDSLINNQGIPDIDCG